MIVLKNVSKQYEMYRRKVIAVDDVSLIIPEHSFISIVGKSGSGKSTLLHLLSGLDSPSKGQILIDNIDLNMLSINEREKFRNEKIGFVFQFFNLIPELTVKENILFPTIFSKKRLDKNYYDSIISILGLTNRINHLPCQLSGGEQQRVAIARSIINKPKYLMMDEPTGNLDSESTQVIIRMLKNIYKSSRQTLIIVTHDSDVANSAMESIVISDGKIKKAN